ncbi:hypothetical protein SDC9_152050 [bioreactor metagenome]|uniref:Uncharacterized protein n=1 Tax=bioreactor metagenome TaxID=1076179 RepID=A0A645EUA5_9ZZZZ
MILKPSLSALLESSAISSGSLTLIVTSVSTVLPLPPKSLHMGCFTDLAHMSWSAMSIAALALVFLIREASRMSRQCSRSDASAPVITGLIISSIAPLIDPTVSPVTFPVGGAEPHPDIPQSVSILTITSVISSTVLTAVLKGTLSGVLRTPVFIPVIFIISHLFSCVNFFLNKNVSISKSPCSFLFGSQYRYFTAGDTTSCMIQKQKSTFRHLTNRCPKGAGSSPHCCKRIAYRRVDKAAIPLLLYLCSTICTFLLRPCMLPG